MVVEELRPLADISDVGNPATVRFGDNVELCFNRQDIESGRQIPGTFAAMVVTERYLRSAREYMEIRRLIYNLIVEERRTR